MAAIMYSLLLASTYLLSANSQSTAPSDFDFFGQGECRQSDGAYGLTYNRGYSDLNPWTDGNNAQQATDRCQQTCAVYSWCLAAEVVLRDIWSTPECALVTDRPTFESIYGSNQVYQWGYQKTIDGVSYQTYCAGGGCSGDDGQAMSFDGGSLNSRDGYYCYINMNPNTAPPVVTGGMDTTTTAPPDLVGQGECRQSDGAYGLAYNIGYGDLDPWADGNNQEQATQRCKRACDEYSWCYAAQVVFVSHWTTPDCSLITDRPTFESVYGTDQDYSWGYSQSIDGVSYQTYCAGGNPECSSDNDLGSNWDGGSLYLRAGYWCYVKPFASYISIEKTQKTQKHTTATDDTALDTTEVTQIILTESSIEIFSNDTVRVGYSVQYIACVVVLVLLSIAQ